MKSTWGTPKEERPIRPLSRSSKGSDKRAEVEDGAISADGRVWGTYLHGLFDNDGFRRRFIDSLRKNKGLLSGNRSGGFDYKAFKEQEYDKLAAVLRKELDMARIYRIIGISSSPPALTERGLGKE